MLYFQPTLSTFLTAFPWQYTFLRLTLCIPSNFNQPLTCISCSLSHFLIFLPFCNFLSDFFLTNYLLYAFFFVLLCFICVLLSYLVLPQFSILLPSPLHPSLSCSTHPHVYVSSNCLKIISGPSAPNAALKKKQIVCTQIHHFNVVNIPLLLQLFWNCRLHKIPPGYWHNL